MPVRNVDLGRRSVPDLARIDRARWVEVLLPLSRKDRMDAALHPLIRGGAAYEVAKDLPPPASEAAWSAIGGAPAVPVPSAPSRAARQVNFRLTDEELADLQRAAHVLGLRPTQLARMLVLNGVRRMLVEHDAAMVPTR
ncbi:MAG TPA: hypothetical protein VF533_18060 [Solirubrobacteraceae bacterium]|jgi:hypothetical protein